MPFWRPGAADWTTAQVNTALAAGDSLYTGAGGAVGLQSGSRAFVRGGDLGPIQATKETTKTMPLGGVGLIGPWREACLPSIRVNPSNEGK